MWRKGSLGVSRFLPSSRRGLGLCTWWSRFRAHEAALDVKNREQHNDYKRRMMISGEATWVSSNDNFFKAIFNLQSIAELF